MRQRHSGTHTASFDRVALLADIATRLLMEERPEQVASDIYTRLAAHLDLDLYLNYLVAEDGVSLDLVGWAGLSEADVAPIRRIGLGQAVCGTVALRGRPIVAEQIHLSDDRMLDAARSFGAVSYACHPLVGRRGLLGTLAFGSRRRPVFSDDEIRLMATVTSQAAVAIERARLFDALTASESRLRAVLDVLPVAVFIADAEGRPLKTNPAADGLWGNRLKAEGTAGYGDYRGWWPETGRPIRQDEWGVVRAVRDNVARIGEEMDVETFDGRRLTILNYALPIHDDTGRVTGGVSVDVDITERKATERALEQANVRKDIFLATLAHELRNPLAPIRYALRLLDEPGNEAARVKARAVIGRQLAHLVRLVDDLLDVSRITRNKVELRRRTVALDEVVNQAIECSHPELDQARHCCLLRLPAERIWLDADPDRLSQVLTNLLNNASRYTPPGGRIVVSAALEGDRVRVSVEDNGIGIAAGEAPQLFDLFSQANRTPHASYGGLGIGLALAKALTELHGGTIGASSEGPGRGSVFTVTLPVASAPMHAVVPAADARMSPQRHLRILVVDDNCDAADMLCTALACLGHHVHIAYDAPRGLALALEHRPDVALLDIGLPGMDGYELARRIRREEALRGMRLVAITGWGQDEDRRRAWQAGFDEHLTKPADLDVLERLLAS